MANGFAQIRIVGSPLRCPVPLRVIRSCVSSACLLAKSNSVDADLKYNRWALQMARDCAEFEIGAKPENNFATKNATNTENTAHGSQPTAVSTSRAYL